MNYTYLFTKFLIDIKEDGGISTYVTTTNVSFVMNFKKLP